MISIDKAKCKGCGSCVDVCPVQAISLIEGIAVIDNKKCIECESCVSVCPVGAISFNKSDSDLRISQSPVQSFMGRGLARSKVGFGRGGFRQGRRGGRGRGRRWRR
jgi:NAD-dependent dihydropyrimidine dehydrogenase PreA subunit